jgi:hypothetical protein
MIYDAPDPMGKMFFNILATFAEFEVDLLRMRTRDCMAIAKAKGKLKGRAPKPVRRSRTGRVCVSAVDESAGKPSGCGEEFRPDVRSDAGPPVHGGGPVAASARAPVSRCRRCSFVSPLPTARSGVPRSARSRRRSCAASLRA